MGKAFDKPDTFLAADSKAIEPENPVAIEDLILRGTAADLASALPKPMRRISLPILPSKEPGTLELDNAKLFELVPFP